MLALLQRYLTWLVFAAGILVGALVGGVVVSLDYTGFTLPVPFTHYRLTIFEGKIGQAVAGARKEEKVKCDADNLRARLQATEHLLDAANATIEQDRAASVASQAKLSVLRRNADAYEEEIERKDKALAEADAKTEEAAKADGTKVIYRNRCAPLGRADIDRLRHAWGQQ